MRIMSLNWPSLQETVVELWGHFERPYEVVLEVYIWIE